MISKEDLRELRDKLQPNVINGDNAIETLNNALLIDAIEKDLEELEEYRKMIGTPIQELIKCLKRLEKQDKMLKSLNEYKETIKKRIESLEEYKNHTYNSKNETEYFKTIGSLDAYGKVFDLLSEVLNNEKEIN